METLKYTDTEHNAGKKFYPKKIERNKGKILEVRSPTLNLQKENR